jgi:hypothetical protein
MVEDLEMDRTIRAGDLTVCRVNGTYEFYVIGTVVAGRVGALSLRAMSTVVGRESALRQAYAERSADHQVWLFDGAAAAYVETIAPPARGAVHI